MQPKFFETLRMTPDGKRILAGGPISQEGDEREAYITVWITQKKEGQKEGVTANGIGEKELSGPSGDAVGGREPDKLFPPLTAGKPDTDAKWDLPVAVTGKGKFREGDADCLAWIFVRGKRAGDEYDVTWKDRVRLKIDEAVTEELDRSAA
jgi:hypothetical protein